MGGLDNKGYVPKPGEAALSLVARNAIMNYEKGRLTERKSASSEKEQQQPEPVTDEVEVTAPSPAPASPVYPDLSSLKNSPPYELLSQNNPFLPAPPKAIQAPQFKVKSGYLEMEESTQKPLLEAVKTLSSVTTSALTDLQRSNEHMISMANRLATLEDSLMLKDCHC
ncbi:Aspartyl/glutamyl-tRNA(Asn/Gln) amidotransferase subunit B [Dissostichus eleginoides]|uniref:Aspartyl/glutamyl-tRNA(Asn/Gln) amidotransferase subunit B n=1 Tax=Dissostichus eleginoides TaxID=100907 RepID=A0AAD9B4C8_DISEL|nr:Aspartyl/glutamyl-tRNA(Asn/Gln) amidotransferase subunit B [Dissostichus eleginoides]